MTVNRSGDQTYCFNNGIVEANIPVPRGIRGADEGALGYITALPVLKLNGTGPEPRSEVPNRVEGAEVLGIEEPVVDVGKVLVHQLEAVARAEEEADAIPGVVLEGPELNVRRGGDRAWLWIRRHSDCEANVSVSASVASLAGPRLLRALHD